MNDYLLAQALYPADGNFAGLWRVECYETLLLQALHILAEFSPGEGVLWTLWCEVLETPRLRNEGQRARILTRLVMRSEETDHDPDHARLGLPVGIGLGWRRKAREAADLADVRGTLRHALYAWLGRPVQLSQGVVGYDDPEAARIMTHLVAFLLLETQRVAARSG